MKTLYLAYNRTNPEQNSHFTASVIDWLKKTCECDRVIGMKISELKLVPKSRRGKFLKNGVKLEPHEEDTANVLTLYGFTVDVIKPLNTPKVHNADFLIDGVIWEVKSPLSSNKKTIKKRMHEASEQSERVVVDLRRIKKDYRSVEKDIIDRFCNKGTFRRMIIINKTGSVFYYEK